MKYESDMGHETMEDAEPTTPTGGDFVVVAPDAVERSGDIGNEAFQVANSQNPGGYMTEAAVPELVVPDSTPAKVTHPTAAGKPMKMNEGY